MKKNVLRSLIVMLGMMMIFSMVGCVVEDDNDNKTDNSEKVDSKYWGKYKTESIDNGNGIQYMRAEIKEKSITFSIMTNDNSGMDFIYNAWSDGNKLLYNEGGNTAANLIEFEPDGNKFKFKRSPWDDFYYVWYED